MHLLGVSRYLIGFGLLLALVSHNAQNDTILTWAYVFILGGFSAQVIHLSMNAKIDED